MSILQPQLDRPLLGAHPAVVSRRLHELVRVSIAGLIVLAVALGIALRESNPDFLLMLAILAAGLGVVYLVVNPRLEVTVLTLAVYLGCLDGPVKLLTAGGHVVSAFRDVLIASVCLGALLREHAKHERLRLPPLFGWVLVFVLCVLVETFNPNTAGVVKALGGYRQQLEWVPFFFFGYLLIRSKQRFRALFIVLAVIAAANALVSAYQVRLNPHALAAWGPGYTEKVLGTNGVTGTTFFAGGEGRVRPLGLGSDIGFGGDVAGIALPGILMLLATARARRRWIYALLCIAALLGVAVSLSRTDVLGAAVIVFAFTVLSFSAGHRVARPLVAILVIGALTIPLVSVLTSAEGSAIFSRYASIKPEQAASSSSGYKAVSLGQIPKVIAADPFGFGLGTAGPASTFGGHTTVKLEGHGFSSETEYNYLVNELGAPGLLFWAAFSVMLGVLVLRGLPRVEDPDVRIALAAVFSVLAGLTIEGFAGAYSAGSAGGPYFWFAAGVGAYWLTGPARTRTSSPAITAGAV
jgi:hypothetical protein